MAIQTGNTEVIERCEACHGIGRIHLLGGEAFCVWCNGTSIKPVDKRRLNFDGRVWNQKPTTLTERNPNGN